jgi:gamma-glutamylcyclotransferase (GGCT)/AIG2-like uncharacterized protein YtfP
MRPRNIFTYGSLMFAEVWQDIVKLPYENQTAWLDGFRRTYILGDQYPVVLPRAGQKNLQGVVYFSVKEQDIARLDRFEGEHYYRRRVHPTIKVDGEPKIIEADVYVLKPKYADLATLRSWDPELFERRDLHFFRKMHSSN